MTPTQTSFAEELIAYWLSFVRAGDPNTHRLAGSAEWPAYSAGAPGTRKRISLQEVPASYGEVEPELEAKRCAFAQSKALHQQA